MAVNVFKHRFCSNYFLKVKKIRPRLFREFKLKLTLKVNVNSPHLRWNAPSPLNTKM